MNETTNRMKRAATFFRPARLHALCVAACRRRTSRGHPQFRAGIHEKKSSSGRSQPRPSNLESGDVTPFSLRWRGRGAADQLQRVAGDDYRGTVLDMARPLLLSEAAGRLERCPVRSAAIASMSKMKQPVLILAALLFAPWAALGAAELKLAGIFTDHAVLQRDVVVPVWGWADAGEQLTVEFAGQTKTATADASGKWLAKLDPMPACAEGRELVVQSSSENRKSKITDVVVGDVWLCSGQSNMGIPMSVPGNDDLQRRIAEANNPRLRLFTTLHQFPDAPVNDTRGRWSAATPDVVKNWIAIGYLFGERIQRETGVPVGILVSCMGGTSIESWLPRAVLDANPANAPYLNNHARAVKQLPEAMKRYEKELAEFKQHHQPGQREPRKPDGFPNSARNPSACFNGKIAPILPYALKGVLWYQGEGNVSGFTVYPSQMADLMRTWREIFELPRLPFIMTELAPLGQPSSEPQDSARARFGEALAKTAKADGNAWVITIVDGGDPLDIHPVKKEIPAERFEAMALAKIYGKTRIAHGPMLVSWKATGGTAVVKFSSMGGGLTVKSVNLGGHQVTTDKLQGFELAGTDKHFFRAEARIEGKDTVILTSPDVPQPVAVRYAWAAFPLCNLFNADGFAAYPFRTDDWPWKTPPDPTTRAAPTPK
jgi:sialate O-acetylesterase